jgi:hypothetical protein
LVAAVNNPRAAPADFDGVQEAGSYQLSSDPTLVRGLGAVRAFFGHIADGPPM